MPAAQPRYILAALAAFAAGCGGGDGYPRVPVSGTVTLDGQPLATGTITFEPKQPLPTQAGGKVVAGKFEIPKEAGPVPGEYAVAIFGGPVDPKAAAEFDGGAISRTDPRYEKLREVVPAKFNSSTTLSAQVRAGEPNSFQFDLRSDPKAK